MGRGTFSGLSATGFVFKVKTIEVARLCEMKRKKICQTSTRLMEVAGMKGNLSQETERLTPKGKAQNSFSHPKKLLRKGWVWVKTRKTERLVRANVTDKGGK